MRSAGSLIQTIGRAARNVNGKAIMYADKETRSMKIALDETSRRREKQIQFNLDNNIEPKTIIKNIQDIMEGAKPSQTKRFIKIPNQIKKKLQSDNPSDVSKLLDELEVQMFNAAKDLDFEEAAKIRDEIKLIKDLNFGINYVDSTEKVRI